MQNLGLDESQAGIKTNWRNIKKKPLRYVDDTTLMAESKEKLKSLFMMRMKEESGKAVKKLKLNI